MKVFYIAAIALASASAFAQAPAGTVMPAPQEASTTASGGIPAAKAEMNKDTKTMGSGRALDMKAMDANGDGMISQEEYMTYHGNAWKKMKMTKNGMMSMDDMQKQMNNGDGPN
jgi:hypothetical protein